MSDICFLNFISFKMFKLEVLTVGRVGDCGLDTLGNKLELWSGGASDIGA